MYSKKNKFFDEFTCVIPAAGKSKRFESNTNKMLFKINNKILIKHVIDKVNKITKKIIIICNKDNIDQIKKGVKSKNYAYLIQQQINGMATAIKKSFSKIKTKHCFIIWGDQIGIQRKTILLTINNYLKNDAKILFPVLYKNKPYTLVKFDKNLIFNNVIQSRESIIKQNFGYTDCGFFCCNTKFLIENLNHCIKEKKNLTKKTKEYDFLTSLKHFNPKKSIKVIITKNRKDNLGINFLNDVGKIK